MTSDPIVLLSEHGAWRTRVTLDPDHGGAIVSYASSSSAEQVNWLHPGAPGLPGCFPMVPFCSRIRGGCFRFADHHVALPANNPPEPHAIHGHGFQCPWQVDALSSDRAVLSYAYPGGAWPWPYVARQEVMLDGMNLRVQLSLENRAADDMPCGLGLHPYFPLGAGARLKAAVSKWLRLDAAGMPLGVADVPAELDLSAGVKMGEFDLDHVFLGWDGVAEMAWDDGRGLRLRVPDLCEHLVVFAPAGAVYFCVEPVANVPDGFNFSLADWRSFQTLAPGQTLSTEYRFEPYGVA